MEIPKIFESEYKFCEILWEHEPVSSSELVKLCFEKLGWKKSTTYTVIRRLTERGVLQSKDTIVTSLVPVPFPILLLRLPEKRSCRSRRLRKSGG